jgi:hypothetical protein
MGVMGMWTTIEMRRWGGKPKGQADVNRRCR